MINLSDWIANPSVVVYVVVGIFGLCIGSFLNVVIYRLPLEGMSIVHPGSACPSCKNPIRWYDNIPVFSYLFLGGRCRFCKTGISIRYPLIELLTALSFVATLYWSQGTSIPLFLVRVLLVAAFIAVTFIDFDHFIIPDSISITGMFVAPVFSFLVPELHRGSFLARISSNSDLPNAETALIASLLGIVAGAGSVYLVGLGGKFLFKKDAMGFGDVKLMGAAGGFLGAEAVLAAFFIGAMVGAVFGILNVLWLGTGRALRLMKRGVSTGRAIGMGMKLGRRLGSYIPFGPFLSLGCLAMLFFREGIFHLIQAWPRWVQGLAGKG